MPFKTDSAKATVGQTAEALVRLEAAAATANGASSLSPSHSCSKDEHTLPASLKHILDKTVKKKKSAFYSTLTLEDKSF